MIARQASGPCNPRGFADDAFMNKKRRELRAALDDAIERFASEVRQLAMGLVQHELHRLGAVPLRMPDAGARAQPAAARSRSTAAQRSTSIPKRVRRAASDGRPVAASVDARAAPGETVGIAPALPGPAASTDMLVTPAPAEQPAAVAGTVAVTTSANSAQVGLEIAALGAPRPVASVAPEVVSAVSSAVSDYLKLASRTEARHERAKQSREARAERRMQRLERARRRREAAAFARGRLVTSRLSEVR